MSAAEVWLLVGAGLIGLLVAGALSPLEALGWWAGWLGELEPDDAAAKGASAPEAAQHYVVFLGGIDSVSGESYAPREKKFLERLRTDLAEDRLIEVFPYSVTSRALTGQRLLARLWRWLLAKKLQGNTAGFLINLRNVWQVLVSADRRYGPLYNEGTAELMLHALKRHGYLWESGTPVTLIGYSGGGQIACGAAGLLKDLLNAPVQVISLGGVISSDSGLTRIDHLYHLYGEHDGVQRLGERVFPGRWSLFPNSSWNRALNQGRITRVPMGSVKHSGAGGYLDDEAFYPEGDSYAQKTLQVITGIVRDEARGENEG